MTLRFGTRKTLSSELTAAIMAAARSAAATEQVRVCIAILDDGGHLLDLHRMDGVHAGTVEVAIAKARTAVLFRAPTSRYAEALTNGAVGLLALPAMLPFPGGVPLMVDGMALGAVGISGAAPDIDGRIAAAAAAVIQE
jgi:uncharacterized protein GlcG (DUF336 family)